jgi:hypothetical protein
MRIFYAALLVTSAILFSCDDKARRLGASSPWEDTAKFPRLYVNSKNGLMLNNRLVSIEELENKFIELKDTNNFFLYSSDSASADPPTTGPVFELFRKYGIGVKMYTDSTFTKSFD